MLIKPKHDPTFLYDGEDEPRGVEQVYGGASSPEDYITACARFVEGPGDAL